MRSRTQGIVIACHLPAAHHVEGRSLKHNAVLHIAVEQYLKAGQQGLSSICRVAVEHSREQSMHDTIEGIVQVHHA